MTINELENKDEQFLNSEIDEEEIDDEYLENDDSDEEKREPFDPTTIRFKTQSITMDRLLKRMKHNEINLASDLHRNAGIWTPKAQSRLIESLLLHFPIGLFYIDATDDDKWLVIDGLQRISTFKSFILDQTLKLTGLEFLKELEGKTYDQLPRHYQRRINETELMVYLIEPGTLNTLKYKIFQRINTGGLPLNNQELRQAMNQGQATEILIKLANSLEFERVTDLSNSKKERMDDHELILSFIAFILTPYENYPVNEGHNYFLNEAMKELNKIDKGLVQDIENKFIFAMKSAYEIFGEDAFRKISHNSSKKSPVSKALFEGWSVSLSQLTSQEIETLINKKEQLKKLFIKEMQNDPEFQKSISHTGSKVQYRFVKIKKIIEEVLS